MLPGLLAYEDTCRLRLFRLLIPGKHRRRGRKLSTGDQGITQRGKLARITFSNTQQIQQLRHGGGHHRLHEDSNLAHHLKGHVEYGIHALKLAVFAQSPRFLFRKVSIRIGKNRPDAL